MAGLLLYQTYEIMQGSLKAGQNKKRGKNQQISERTSFTYSQTFTCGFLHQLMYGDCGVM